MDTRILASKDYKRPAFSLLFLLLCLTTVLASCSGNSSSMASTSSNSATTCDKATGLTLYSAQAYDTLAAKTFQQQTGIQVKVVDASSGILLSKVAAEKNNPAWDVLWFSGDASMQTLDDQGYLLKWNSPSMTNYTAQGLTLVPTDHAYYPSSMSAAGVIAYNINHIPAAGLPKDWNDLTNAGYKNLLAEPDPAYSGPMYSFIAGMAQRMGGENQAKAFFTKLKNNGIQTFKTNNPTLNSIETGAREFAIVQDTVYYAAKHAGQPLGIIYPSSGVTTLPDEMAISAVSKHQACAQQFVNWVLTAKGGQTAMLHNTPTSGDTYFMSIIQGVTSNAARPATGVTFQPLNVHQWASVADELRQWFHDNIVQ